MPLYINALIFPFIQTSLPVPATKKHPHSMMLTPPCFTVGMVLTRWWVLSGFLQTWRLPFRPKSSIFMAWESFRCLLANSRRLSCAFYWEVASVWPLYHRSDWLSAAEIVFLLEGSPLSTEKCWSSVRVTIGFLVTSLTKNLLPRSLSLARWSALGRILVIPNFFH